MRKPFYHFVRRYVWWYIPVYDIYFGDTFILRIHGLLKASNLVQQLNHHNKGDIDLFNRISELTDDIIETDTAVREIAASVLGEEFAFGEKEVPPLSAVVETLILKLTRANHHNWCPACGHPLSLSGPQSLSGEPTMNCRVCFLIEQLNEERRKHVS